MLSGIMAYKHSKKERYQTGRKKDGNREQSKRVLILVNHEVVIYNFRLELVERLLAEGYEVHISTPVGERIEKLRQLGTIIHPISFDRHGMNPMDELGILREYNRLLKNIHPIIVFGYTIKPNIYGAIITRAYKIPFVANITGLGTAVENGGLKQKLTILMYKAAFGTKYGKIQRVFFQNKQNEAFFKSVVIALNKHKVLPGSGVNLERYTITKLPPCGDGKEGMPVKFAFISRIMVEKGVDLYLDAAEKIKKDYPSTEFHVCGFFEPEYDRSRLEKLTNKGIIIFHGNIEDVNNFMSQMHCIVHPTYYPEGISNVLLEACATGRPIITTNRPGCRETVCDGVNGYLIPEHSVKELIFAIKRFLNLSYTEKQNMSAAGRKLVVENFDRSIIVDAYMDELYHLEVTM